MLNKRYELMQYRLEMAKERLIAAKLLLDNGSYKDSIGRSYYAIFTTVRALLAVDGVDFQSMQVSSHIFRRNISRQVYLT